MTRPTRQRLRDTGTVLVSRRALQEYRRQLATPVGEEEARRALTRLAGEARRTTDAESGHERWRVREKGGLDVTLHVGREDGLAVVTSIGRVRAEPRTSRGRDGRSRRR